MDMFTMEDKGITNLLPKDGIADYYGKVFPAETADRYLHYLLNNIAWKNDEAVIFGRHIITKRKIAWYGDLNYEYTYSKVTRHALPWDKELLRLKAVTETLCGVTFNSCLLNLYHDGSEGMAWHSDAEKDLKRDGAIASLSFGAVRKFSFKHKTTKETISVPLAHGSLLVMHGTTQSNWLHRLPPSKLITEPRVNLTFRTIVHN